ncbi:MAG: hypothetical protein ACI92E_000131 [Oceanicoccus sp.]|jgi:uncharacterized protein YqiB (DUF1249 family)
MRKKQYSIDLAGLMAECEANYLRIMKLLPDMSQINIREFGVELAGSAPIQFRLEIKECCKYTTMVDISQRPLLSPLNEDDPDPLDSAESGSPRATFDSWIKPPTFSLRIYHDAKMAEVISFDNHEQLQVKYDYPNTQMYQSNEKSQLNMFLGEWLSHCLLYGHVLEGSTNSVYC